MKKRTKRIVFEVDQEIHEMIKVRAAKEKKSIRALLTQVVNRWLKRE